MEVGAHWLKSSLFLLLLFVMACKDHNLPAPFKLQSQMGSMTVQLFPQYPDLAKQISQTLQSECGKQTVLSFVQQDICIGFDIPCSEAAFVMPKRQPQLNHLRGTIFLLPDAPKNRFFIIQGKPQTPLAIQAFEEAHKTSYSDADRSRYIKYGGTPEFDGRGYPIGVIVEGLEVIDKLAALPTDSNRKPLTSIAVKWLD